METFVTGPLDPAHNQHKFYCQLCKANVSIYSKGAREIIRHSQGESHLRKDHRWRFKHLSVTDKKNWNYQTSSPRKGRSCTHSPGVRKEKPLFTNAPLVDVGEKFPFCDNYIANSGNQQTTEDKRASAQTALIGSFVPHEGNIHLLQTLWSRVGEYMNHRDQFSPFDWRSATLTVSVLLCIPIRVIVFHVLICLFTFGLGHLPTHLHVYHGGSVPTHRLKRHVRTGI